jgi:peroxiredoxin Q/BCP
MSVNVGDKAPSVVLNDQEGKKVSLNDFKGSNIVLYFYPKDNTSGCTKEACDFRDEFPKFGKLKTKIFGVSPDSVESHKKFAAKYNLPFQLLSDENKQVVEKYGVWKEKSMYGRKYMGVERSTFIIDKTGKLRKIFRKVKVADHHKEVINALKEIT